MKIFVPIFSKTFLILCFSEVLIFHTFHIFSFLGQVRVLALAKEMVRVVYLLNTLNLHMTKVTEISSSWTCQAQESGNKFTVHT